MDTLIVLAWLAVFFGIWLRFLTNDGPAENEIGAMFWPLITGGFYGRIRDPGFVFLMPPGAKLLKDSTSPRDGVKIDTEMRSEPKAGPLVVVRMTVILAINPQIKSVDDFAIWYRKKNALESSVLAHMRQFLDSMIRGMEDPTSSDVLSDKIIQAANAEIRRYAEDEFRAIVTVSEFKIDVEDNIRKAIEAKKEKILINKASKEGAKQLKENAEIIRGADKEVPLEKALNMALGNEDKAEIADRTVRLDIRDNSEGSKKDGKIIRLGDNDSGSVKMDPSSKAFLATLLGGDKR